MNTVLKRIAIYRGNITKMGVDAIVNAANSSLLGGGGVDGAIHAAAGLALLAECKELQGCAIGEAKITSGYQLPAPYVIHTVGPVWQGGTADEARLLACCYYNTLQLAMEYQLTTIAFPAISTGAYGFPKERAAAIALKTTLDYLKQNPNIHKVYFVAFDKETEDIYQQQINALEMNC